MAITPVEQKQLNDYISEVRQLVARSLKEIIPELTRLSDDAPYFIGLINQDVSDPFDDKGAFTDGENDGITAQHITDLFVQLTPVADLLNSADCKAAMTKVKV